MDGYNISTAEADRRHRANAPQLPEWMRRRAPLMERLRPWRPFALFVLLPTLLSAFYYVAIATDQYYSDASFIVRSPGKNGAGGGGGNPLAGLLQSAGIGRSQDDTYTVNEYLQSRDALAELVKRDDVRAVFARPEADFLARYPNLWDSASFEDLYKYFQRHVEVTYDTTSGVTELRVRTFRPDDSQRVAKALLQAGERLLNRLNERALHNAVADADHEVGVMKSKVSDIEARLSAFRSKQTVIDPTKESQTMLLGVAQLEEQLSGTQTLIAQLERTSPDSPLLTAAQRRAAALQSQIAYQQQRVTGVDGSMVPRIASYEELKLEEELDQKGLSSAVGSLESAKIEAMKQQLYLDEVVQPNQPDLSLYPRRLIAIGIVFATFLSLYLIGKLLVSGMREHQAH